MQETFSGYGFRIFHHSPGGRVRGRQAVVELAAWGLSCPSLANGSWKTRGTAYRRAGSAPGSMEPGSDLPDTVGETLGSFCNPTHWLFFKSM